MDAPRVPWLRRVFPEHMDFNAPTARGATSRSVRIERFFRRILKWVGLVDPARNADTLTSASEARSPIAQLVERAAVNR